MIILLCMKLGTLVSQLLAHIFCLGWTWWMLTVPSSWVEYCTWELIWSTTYAMVTGKISGHLTVSMKSLYARNEKGFVANICDRCSFCSSSCFWSEHWRFVRFHICWLAWLVAAKWLFNLSFCFVSGWFWSLNLDTGWWHWLFYFMCLTLSLFRDKMTLFGA